MAGDGDFVGVDMRCTARLTASIRASSLSTPSTGGARAHAGEGKGDEEDVVDDDARTAGCGGERVAEAGAVGGAGKREEARRVDVGGCGSASKAEGCVAMVADSVLVGTTDVGGATGMEEARGCAGRMGAADGADG